MQENPAQRPPIGWYVHLPFCKTKCGYCDFYSLPTIQTLIGELVRSLVAELRLRDSGRLVESIFIGGGTPTELPADALDSLLATLADRAGPVGEWTVEANPTSAAELKLETLRRRGVNRISFGAQSFDRDELDVLERLHAPRHIGESVRAARRVGFDNLNLDLIYAIPGRAACGPLVQRGEESRPPQTLDRWRDSLRRAIDLGTEHLSCYALMYEPGTSLTRQRDEGRLLPCDEQVEAEMFELAIEELTAAGYVHYEISNFARPGRECRANIIYWENREYLGIGPSAVSYLDGVRQKNVADVRRYVQWMRSAPGKIVIERERLAQRARACETAVQMLRLSRGIDAALFRLQTGFDAHQLFARPIEQLSKLGLVQCDARAIRLTRRSLLLANRVMSEFLMDPAVESPSAGGAPVGVTRS